MSQPLYGAFDKPALDDPYRVSGTVEYGIAEPNEK